MEAHEILGVPKDASEQQIRAAYKTLALKWHPDRQPQNGEQATSKFVEINKAHRTMLRTLARASRTAKATRDCPNSDTLPPSPSSSESRVGRKAKATQDCPNSDPLSPSPSSSEFRVGRKAKDTQDCPISDPLPPSPPSSESRVDRKAKATQGCPNSDTLPPSPPTSESLYASLKKPTRSTRSRKISSPTSSCSPSSSVSHSSQPSRSSSQTREDTPCASTSSINSALISPSGSFINPKGPEPQTDTLPEESNDQFNTCDSNPKTFHHRLAESLACDPDFMGVTLRPERSILRTDAPKRWVHVLNLTLEDIYQGKTFHFRLIRYELSGKKIILPLDVTVPLGSRDGTKVIVSNIGNERKNGTRQDIVFLVKVLKHKRFSRVHNDLLLEVRLPWVDSLNEKEGEVRVKGIDGKVYTFLVNFCNDGLLSGTNIISNAGMHYLGGKLRGRIVVRWEISSPLSSWDTIKHVFKP